jgi:hypothetical protein
MNFFSNFEPKIKRFWGSISETELKVLYYITNKKKLPAKTPSLRNAIHWITRKGGFLNRKGDGEPGMITLWRGWNRLIDMVQGFEAFTFT